MENLQGSWFPLGSHFGKHHFCNRMSDGTDRKAPMWDVFWTRITSWPPYELCHMMLHVFTMFPLHFCLYLSTWACLFSWKWLITRFVSQSESLYCIAPKRNNKNLNYKKMDYQNNTEDTQSPFKIWNRREEAIPNNFACLNTEILCFCVCKTKSPRGFISSEPEPTRGETYFKQVHLLFCTAEKNRKWCRTRLVPSTPLPWTWCCFYGDHAGIQIFREPFNTEACCFLH